MHLTVFEQEEIFRYAFLLGVLLGVLYDLFAFVRMSHGGLKLVTFVCDVLFMSCSAVVCFMFALTTVHGHFRLFAAVGHLLGFLAYRMSIGLASLRFVRASAKIYTVIIGKFNGLIKHNAKIIAKTFGRLSLIMHNIHISRRQCDRKEKIFSSNLK